MINSADTAAIRHIRTKIVVAVNSKEIVCSVAVIVNITVLIQNAVLRAETANFLMIVAE